MSRLGTDRSSAQQSNPASLAALYPEFAAIDREVKRLICAWQTDTRDRREPLLAELGRVHRRALPLLERMAALDPGYARFCERLATAVVRAGRGEDAYVSGLNVDSFHLVWWRLHTELLRVLGRERSAADA